MRWTCRRLTLPPCGRVLNRYLAAGRRVSRVEAGVGRLRQAPARAHDAAAATAPTGGVPRPGARPATAGAGVLGHHTPADCHTATTYKASTGAVLRGQSEVDSRLRGRRAGGRPLAGQESMGRWRADGGGTAG
jgi:hypothetical protein